MSSKNPIEDLQNLLDADLELHKESAALTVTREPESQNEAAAALVAEAQIKRDRLNFKGALVEGDIDVLRRYIDCFHSLEKLEQYAPCLEGNSLVGMLQIMPDVDNVNLKVLELLFFKFPALFLGEKGDYFRKFLDTEFDPFNRIKNKKAIMEWAAHVVPKTIFQAVLSSSLILENFLKKEENRQQLKNFQETKGCVYNPLAYAIDLYEIENASSLGNLLANTEMLIKYDPELLKWRSNAYDETILMLAARRGIAQLLNLLLKFEIVQETITHENLDSFTALEFAIGTGSLDCVTIFVERNPDLMKRRNKELCSVLDCVESYTPPQYKKTLHQYLAEQILKHKIVIDTFYASKELLKIKESQFSSLQAIKKIKADRFSFLQESFASELKCSRELNETYKLEHQEKELQKSRFKLMQEKASLQADIPLELMAPGSASSSLSLPSTENAPVMNGCNGTHAAVASRPQTLGKRKRGEDEPEEEDEVFEDEVDVSDFVSNFKPNKRMR